MAVSAACVMCCCLSNHFVFKAVRQFSTPVMEIIQENKLFLTSLKHLDINLSCEYNIWLK